MTTRIERTLRTSKGLTVTTTLTDAEAIQLCRRLNNDFCKSLVNKYDAANRSGRWGLSESQFAWIHKFANEGATPTPVESTTPGEFLPLITMMTGARQHVKRPTIKLSLPVNGVEQPLALKFASEKYPDALNVTDGKPFGNNMWYGRINKDGTFIRSRQCPDQAIDLLRQFAKDPAGIAAAHGRMHSICCFCQMPLRDERSVEVGYGPVCAVTMGGLPWGNRSLAPVESSEPLFDDPKLQVEYDRLVKGGMSPHEAEERVFDPMIQKADRQDSARAAAAKMYRDEVPF